MGCPETLNPRWGNNSCSSACRERRRGGDIFGPPRSLSIRPSAPPSVPDAWSLDFVSSAGWAPNPPRPPAPPVRTRTCRWKCASSRFWIILGPRSLRPYLQLSSHIFRSASGIAKNKNRGAMAVAERDSGAAGSARAALGRRCWGDRFRPRATPVELTVALFGPKPDIVRELAWHASFVKSFHLARQKTADYNTWLRLSHPGPDYGNGTRSD